MKTIVKIIGIINSVVLLLCCNSHAYAVGASTPFTTYEAEAGGLGGGATVVSVTSPSTTEFSSPQLEASGHAYVNLASTNQSVTWTNNTGQNITAVNIRACIPDSPSGGGISSTIDLYVNGTFRQAIAVNSTQTWTYETSSNYNGMAQSPSAGTPHIFWDEFRTFITGAAVSPGSTITLQKDSANSANFYYIDCVDLEAPPAALSQPANSLSITSYGAVANNSSFDNSAAFQNCINAAQSQGKSVWIPSGTFYILSGNVIFDSGITIAGAGPWYSTVMWAAPPNTWQNSLVFQGNSCSYQNFCIDSSTAFTTDPAPGMRAFLSYGDNWTINNVWSRHLMLVWGTGNNITVKNSRVTNSWGDGLNLNNDSGTSCNNVLITNNFSRGNGDDAIALNSSLGTAAMMNNVTITNNTGVASWWANELGIYGGSNVVAENNLLQDSVKLYGIDYGVFGSGTGGAGNFLLSALVEGNTILRGGSYGYGFPEGAVGMGGGGQWTNPVVQNAVLSSNTINNAMYDGIDVYTGSNMIAEYNTINSPGSNGIGITSGASGDLTLVNNTVNGLKSGQSAVVNTNPNFTVITGTPISSYNSISGGNFLETCSEGGQDLGTISNGCWTGYNGVNLSGMGTFVARVASAGVGGNIVTHVDSPTGPVIGVCPVPVTGGWQTWTTVSCNLNGASGTHNVYLVYTGGSGFLFNVEWFEFKPGISNNPIEILTCNSLSGGSIPENCSEGGQDLGTISNGFYSEYNNMNLNGMTSFTARVASAGVGGNIVIHTDSATGTVIGTATVPVTGGWQTWTSVSCALSGASGYHNVYLVYTGNSGFLFNVEWFEFQAGQGGNSNPTAVGSYNNLSGSNFLETCSEGGQDLGTISNGCYTEYNNVNMNNVNSFTARVASATTGGIITVHLDSPTGTQIGFCPVPVTGGWQTWTTMRCTLNGASGYHNVYLVYNGASGNIFNVEWFTL